MSEKISTERLIREGMPDVSQSGDFLKTLTVNGADCATILGSMLA